MIDAHLGPERAAVFWQLVAVYESLVELYLQDPEAAMARVDQLSHAETRALLGLSLHALTQARTT